MEESHDRRLRKLIHQIPDMKAMDDQFRVQLVRHVKAVKKLIKVIEIGCSDPPEDLSELWTQGRKTERAGAKLIETILKDSATADPYRPYINSITDHTMILLKKIWFHISTKSELERREYRPAPDTNRHPTPR